MVSYWLLFSSCPSGLIIGSLLEIRLLSFKIYYSHTHPQLIYIIPPSTPPHILITISIQHHIYQQARYRFRNIENTNNSYINMSSQIGKFQTLQSQWSQYSHLSTLESSQRTQDIHNLFQVIGGKISANNMFALAKHKVLSDQCQEIKSGIDQLRISYTKIYEEEKQNIEYFNSRCQDACQLFTEGINKDKDEMLKNAEEKINQIKQTVEQECLTSAQEMNNQKKQILGCKDFITGEMRRYEKSQTESLNDLCKKVKEEISLIRNCLEIKNREKIQKQEKLQLMSQTLLSQLKKTVLKEQKIGRLTYECLLKLIEDFYFHMRSNVNLQ